MSWNRKSLGMEGNESNIRRNLANDGQKMKRNKGENENK